MNEKKLELYLHIPFCVKKCEYCDFLSGPCDRVRQRNYFQAMKQEIQTLAPKYRDWTVSTLFWGGGTPSIADSEELASVMELLREVFSIEENAEITIECNPGTLTWEKLDCYRRMGINRISLGCQSADEQELKILGRIHTFPEFVESFRMARKAGFSNINIDLMSGLPKQTLVSWENTLRQVAELEPEHISAYSLIVEEGTPFYEKELELPDEDTEREMYERTGQILAGYGLFQYEISNYARPGFACRHNIGYWKRENYLGFGIGAASLMEEERFCNERNLDRYMEISGTPELLHQERERLSVKEQMEETMFLGLRLREGVSLNAFRRIFAKELTEIYGDVLEKYIPMGFLEMKDGFLRLTTKGISVSNQILADFLLPSI